MPPQPPGPEPISQFDLIYLSSDEDSGGDSGGSESDIQVVAADQPPPTSRKRPFADPSGEDSDGHPDGHSDRADHDPSPRKRPFTDLCTGGQAIAQPNVTVPVPESRDDLDNGKLESHFVRVGSSHSPSPSPAHHILGGSDGQRIVIQADQRSPDSGHDGSDAPLVQFEPADPPPPPPRQTHHSLHQSTRRPATIQTDESDDNSGEGGSDDQLVEFEPADPPPPPPRQNHHVSHRSTGVEIVVQLDDSGDDSGDGSSDVQPASVALADHDPHRRHFLPRLLQERIIVQVNQSGDISSDDGSEDIVPERFQLTDPAPQTRYLLRLLDGRPIAIQVDESGDDSSDGSDDIRLLRYEPANPHPPPPRLRGFRLRSSRRQVVVECEESDSGDEDPELQLQHLELTHPSHHTRHFLHRFDGRQIVVQVDVSH